MNRIAGKLDRAFGRAIKPLPVLCFLLVFTVAYFLLAHEGFYLNDEFWYAKYAWQFLNGSFSATQNGDLQAATPQMQRFVVILPVAFFFKLLGINIFTATLWPLICSLACLVLLFFLFRKHNPAVAVMGMVLLGLFFYFQFFATFLYPDNISMFFAFASAAVLFYYRYQSSLRQPVFFAALFVVVTFLSYVAKETILYYVPFYAYVFISDLYRKKHTVFWGSTLGLAVLVLAIYLGYYYFYTGDWLFRIHVYEQSNYDAKSTNFFYSSSKTLLNRLTVGPLQFFIGTGVMVPFVLTFGLFLHTRFRQAIRLERKSDFWLGLMLFAMAQFWFGSTAFGFYTPVPLKVRFITILMPPLCVAAAFALEYFWQNSRKSAGLFALLFLAICLVDRSNTLAIYLPLALYFSWCWWKLGQPDFKISIVFGVLLFMAVLSLRPLHFMLKPTAMAFQQQDQLIQEYLNNNSGNFLVLTDDWLLETLEFHYQFEPNPHYTFRPFKASENYKKYDQVFLLLNSRSMQNPDLAGYHSVPFPEVELLYPSKKLVAEKGPVKLFRIFPKKP